MNQPVYIMCIIFLTLQVFSRKLHIQSLALTKHLKEQHFTPFIIITLKYIKVYPVCIERPAAKDSRAKGYCLVCFCVCCCLTKDKECEKLAYALYI